MVISFKVPFSIARFVGFFFIPLIIKRFRGEPHVKKSFHDTPILRQPVSS